MSRLASALHALPPGSLVTPSLERSNREMGELLLARAQEECCIAAQLQKQNPELGRTDALLQASSLIDSEANPAIDSFTVELLTTVSELLRADIVAAVNGGGAYGRHVLPALEDLKEFFSDYKSTVESLKPEFFTTCVDGYFFEAIDAVIRVERPKDELMELRKAFAQFSKKHPELARNRAPTPFIGERNT